MTVSLRVMSAGNGYRYLTSQVASGDGRRELGTPLVRYYAETGTPPGWWTGSGLAGLGDDAIGEGAVVTEEQMRRLAGNGEHPTTGEPLGRRFFRPVPVKDRIERRVRALRPGMGRAERREAIAAIQDEELGRKRHHAVAGFDLTFSVPKSVSVLWGLADAGTQALILAAHHEAIGDVLRLVEREVAATRSGVHGVVHEDVQGVIAMCFDHFDSRAGDPQLHTHVVVANRVQTASGVWQTLDSRAVHHAVVGLSEHYGGLLADHLARTLGVGWQARTRGRDRNPSWEIETVPEVLVDEFSARSRQIETEKDRLIADYLAAHGRQPSARTVIRLRQQATLATRPAKQQHSLRDLSRSWRERGAKVLGGDLLAWARQATGATPVLGWRADDVTATMTGQLGAMVVDAVSLKRSTWRHWNLVAEASRQLMGARFASSQDREQVVAAVVRAAEAASEHLTPGEAASTPARFCRADGSTQFRPRNAIIYSSAAILHAEDRLLALAGDRSAPTCTPQAAEAGGRVLDEGQRLAATQIASSGLALDVLVGPAGTGKTTTLAALRSWWEAEHGPGSVTGLAPSAAAADVLASELRIGCENTAKWRHEFERGRWQLQAGQLVIVDEASLAGTLTIEQLASHAADAGAKVLLVGDWAQLSAVDAGGAFAILVRSLDKVPELSDVRRFHHEWEKTATIQLRVGEPAALDAYEFHDRVKGGTSEQMIQAAYNAWDTDKAAGRPSILLAADGPTVTQLNTRARLDLQAASIVETGGVPLADGTEAGQGDEVITRRNDRRLAIGHSWVKNGDRWQVLARHDDGALTVRRADGQRAGTITLPAAYVAEHVDLGYAITVQRAQGCTVHSAHVVVTPSLTRESLYVAMTRGRASNTAYVTCEHDGEAHQAGPHTPSARDVLTDILARTGAEPSAHQTAQTEQEAWSSRRQLQSECAVIEQAAEHDLAIQLIEDANLPKPLTEAILASPQLASLITEVRRAADYGARPHVILRSLVANGHANQSADPAAHLAENVRRAIDTHIRRGARPHPTRAGSPLGNYPAELQAALEERRRLIQLTPDDDFATIPAPAAAPVHGL